MACVGIIVLGVGGTWNEINNLYIKIKTMQLFCESNDWWMV
ncbi:hypothetical protein ACIROD_24460 [Peribacillus sp. NPDC101481]